jgi:hypothetical protein
MGEPSKNMVFTSFEIQIGGFFGSSYSVAKKDDRTLLYSSRSEDQIEEE